MLIARFAAYGLRVQPETRNNAPLSAPLSASPRVLSWLAAMAEALTLPLLLLHRDGQLLNANMAGMRELARGKRLVRHGDHVRAAVDEERERFAQLLERSADLREREQWGTEHAEGPVLIAPVDGRRGADRALLMVVLPAEASATDACTLFAYQYGLSSGEFEVLHALCTGHSPTEIARSRGVSLSTVRTQMARLRRKCGEQRMNTLALPPRGAQAGK
jgi:DNA-binding CsgD family transcriptional regulator